VQACVAWKNLIVMKLALSEFKPALFKFYSRSLEFVQQSLACSGLLAFLISFYLWNYTSTLAEPH